VGTTLDHETLDLTLDAIREYTQGALPDATLLDLDEKDEFPADLVRDMCGAGLGVSLLFIDEDYGGMGGGSFDVYRVCETLGRVDLGVATGVLATFLGMDPIKVGGTPEQQKLYMSRLAEEGLLMAYAATEPEAGSDLGALKTVAVPHEDGYKITGNKQWISNGAHADLYSVLAMAPGGPTWFIVEKGTEGLSAGRPEDKHGIRASNTSSVHFDDVFVTNDALLGGTEGQGLAQAQRVFGYTRLMVAAFGLGAGWEAIDRAIAYSEERIQAGSPLSRKQGYTHKLIVPHAVRLEASRAYIEDTARRIDGEEGSLNTEGAIAKYLATEAGNAASEAAIQALGGYGYTREYMVEKIKRDVRITTIYEGTSEIMEMTVARDRWQAHMKTRGGHYHELAGGLESLHQQSPGVGADTAALALHALAEIFETARARRLTRGQHVLLRLGELASLGEGAAVFARRAADAMNGGLPDKSDRRFDGATLAAMSRLFAREAAARIAHEGSRLIVGASDEVDAAAAADALRVSAITSAQKGLLADMDLVADSLYGRRAED
jgi:alkylation response protein AidB-like acyl-CoA dehydrogenase